MQYNVFEKMGAVKIREEETAFSRFVESFRKTAEEDGQDLEKFRHLFGESDDEAVYCYSLNPNTFRQKSEEKPIELAR